ncbi:UrcA family protein [Erythrobacter rubeus]|uniref:UrcA family protein n=1 Tax=Erythrobacter rubeus TaxID=2760803 RepID=A0ABR8KQG5_9SPHN|nr:UrcA family protein [Erythrobacter rubeus]MBD2842964.1 UrcA family protein [Erythrobacter rubeus]
MRFTLPLLALAAIAAPASAQSGEEVVDVRIAIADINLNTAEGRSALEQRIDAQIEKACTIETNSRYGYGRDIIDEKCLANARADALAKVERVAADRARGGREVAAN